MKLLTRLIVCVLCLGGYAIPACAADAQADAAQPLPKLYAQALVDMIVAEHPELDKVSIHSYSPAGAVSSSCIIGSKDPAKPGDPDDEEDFNALTTPQPNFYYSKDQGLYKGLFQLLDVAGLPVGSLTLAYRYTSKSDEAQQAATMTAIRDGLKVLIPNQASLFETGKVPRPPYAQRLTDLVMARHPELVRISIHVAAAGAPIMNTYVIAGKDLTPKHLPMIGASDDGEDFLPLTTGKASFLHLKERNMYKGLLPLYEASGQTIGVLLLAVADVAPADESQVQASMTQIRDMLKVNIPDRAALFASNP